MGIAGTGGGAGRWRLGAAAVLLAAALLAGCGSASTASRSQGGPSAAGGDGLIAFGRGRGLWVIGSDGTGLRRLPTPVVRGDSTAFPQAQWSPDGRRIAFLSGSRRDPRSSDRLWVMDAGGGAQEPLTEPGLLTLPRWSPDGRTLAFIRARRDRQGRDLFASDLWLVPAEGGAARRLPGPPGGVLEYAWSPDGARIAMSGDPDPRDCWECDSSDLFVVEVDGTGLRNLTRTPYQELQPGWSPDGGRITVVQREDLFSVEPQTGTRTRMTRNARAGRAVWSPDGAHIALERRTGFPEEYDIWSLEVATGRMTDLTPGPGHEGLPAWAPDGRRLAFLGRPRPRTLLDDETPTDVYVVDLDGGPPRNLTRLARLEPLDAPAYQPTGG